jgi:hypothetical protein
MTPPAALRARVLAAAAATPSLTRSQGRRAAAMSIGFSVGLAILLFELMGGFAHSAGRPIAITAALSGGWSLAAVGLSRIALGRSRSMLARRPTVLLLASISAPAAAFVWSCLFYGTYTEPFARVGFRCLALTLLIAATPLATFLWLRRGVEPRRPSALGGVAGAMCGAWAGVIVHAWCPLTNPAHALVGHSLPIALLVVVGAVIGRRMLDVVG